MNKRNVVGISLGCPKYRLALTSLTSVQLTGQTGAGRRCSCLAGLKDGLKAVLLSASRDIKGVDRGGVVQAKRKEGPRYLSLNKILHCGNLLFQSRNPFNQIYVRIRLHSI